MALLAHQLCSLLAQSELLLQDASCSSLSTALAEALTAFNESVDEGVRFSMGEATRLLGLLASLQCAAQPVDPFNFALGPFFPSLAKLSLTDLSRAALLGDYLMLNVEALEVDLLQRFVLDPSLVLDWNVALAGHALFDRLASRYRRWLDAWFPPRLALARHTEQMVAELRDAAPPRFGDRRHKNWMCSNGLGLSLFGLLSIGELNRLSSGGAQTALCGAIWGGHETLTASLMLVFPALRVPSHFHLDAYGHALSCGREAMRSWIKRERLLIVDRDTLVGFSIAHFAVAASVGNLGEMDAEYLSLRELLASSPTAASSSSPEGSIRQIMAGAHAAAEWDRCDSLQHLAVLQPSWAVQSKHFWAPLCKSAAAAVTRTCGALQWMLTTGAQNFGLAGDLCTAAAGAGNLAALRCLRAQPRPCPWDPATYASARAFVAEHPGETALLRYLQEERCPGAARLAVQPQPGKGGVGVSSQISGVCDSSHAREC